MRPTTPTTTPAIADDAATTTTTKNGSAMLLTMVELATAPPPGGGGGNDEYEEEEPPPPSSSASSSSSKEKKRKGPTATAVGPPLPIETVHALSARGKAELLGLLRGLNGGLVAHRILKDAAADRRLHVLTIVRRMRYCLQTP
jgi:hypothetical protein